MPNPARIHKIKEFIQFFESIPADAWCIGHMHHVEGTQIKSCAMGHLQYQFGVGPALRQQLYDLANILREETQWLSGRLAEKFMDHIAWLNDGIGFDHYGNHPKTRILNVLKICLEKESRLQKSGTAEV